MIDRFSTIFTARQVDTPIETARAIAVVLLVAYHAIGLDEQSGLGLSSDHPLRLFSDFFVDLRMPLFAFIAGFVYGIRPVAPAEFPRFLAGKGRRLVIPGVTAITLFLLVSNLMGTGFAMYDQIYRAYIFPYAHYWFLLSILTIFVVFGAIDVFSRGRLLLPCFAAALALYLSGIFVPGNILSLNGSIYLLPYFIFGTIFVRHGATIAEARLPIIAIAAICVLLASWWNIAAYRADGQFSTDRRDLQSLAFALGACSLALLALPKIDLLARIGPVTFTIYLYHVFGTSGMRRALTEIGITAPEIQFPMVLLAGLILPVLIHIAASQTALTRRLVLGTRA